jgi:hypothetical protein
MDDAERQTLERLHRECTAALAKLLKEGEEMCSVLSAIERHPASHEERRAIMEQRVKENAAQMAYDSARRALFTRAGWGV